ncbi:MAG: hypothetical protein HC939_16465 [Pleurocapsa sp. SU_5_0]|nr:hypothetical protein [Pleurocapsa sp. SU_5_0]NJO97899.1 hypothetical protein [Pleurocapsa sp. CRU_1_2]
MADGIYLRGVMNILNLSESAVNKLVDEGYLTFTKRGPKGKRVFDKALVQELKRNPVYQSLKKQTVLVYLRCDTEEQERIMKRKVEQYCKKNNLKANIIAQLNQGIKEISQQSYRAIINYIFEHTGIAGLIFYGHTDDINEIKKIFQAREEAFSYCVQDLA